MKTIMIATDGSEQAGEALDVAIELAKDVGAKLEVLSVRPQRLAGRAGSGAEHIAEAGVATAAVAGVDATAHVAHGDVVDCICTASGTLDADLLVVGSRGHGSVTGALLGSVSHALIKRSQIPVTIVGHAVVHAS